ncbi:MAG: electron transfer flavoprotein subunit beta/FixA family protein [Candidatus Binatia bacterium]
MHVIVCVKQIPNPETPAHLFKVDEATQCVLPAPNMPLVMSPFDEQAIEAALRIRDVLGDVKITVVSLGPESAREVLKHGLAMGADEAILLADPAFEGADGYTTALALTEAIKKVGEYDLILTGRQAADWDAGVVGLGIAELLDVPALTFAKDVQVDGRTVRVERVLQDGFETVEAPLPAVVTISNELGEPRSANLRQVMRAARKKATVWAAADLGLDPSQVGASGAHLTVERLFVPVKENQCEFITGESPQEQAANLLRRLQELRVL